MAGKKKRVSVVVRSPERHNGAFVVGSVIGGLAGAAVALWTAPRTGAELRQRLTGGESASVTTRTGTTVSGTDTSTPLTGRVLSFVERAAAPIVGVKLGQTANGSGPVPGETGASTTIRADTAASSDAGARGRVEERITYGTYSGRTSTPSTSRTETFRVPAASSGVAASVETEPSATMTPTPSPASTSIPEGTPGHVPSTEELVSPSEPVVDPARTSTARDEDKLFPEFDDSTKRS